MVDTRQLKDSIDCRTLIENDIGQPDRRGRTFWRWRCPFHHEQHGFSLVANEERWHCFGACQLNGDAVAWVQHYHSIDFREACRMLGAELSPFPDRAPVQKPLNKPSKPVHKIAEPPSADWQSAAFAITTRAEETLWSPAGVHALAYLQEQRGLTAATIQAARLGFVPGHYRDWRTLYGLSVPCGITIPWLSDGLLWGIKVRRATGDPRYEQVAGGNIAGGLYWADYLLPRWPALLVEGEFNCLIAWQEARSLICPVSLGSASSSLNPRWYAALAVSPTILACYDADEAGDKARQRVQSLSQRVRFVQVPEGKDINEFFLRGQRKDNDVSNWIVQALDNTS